MVPQRPVQGRKSGPSAPIAHGAAGSGAQATPQVIRQERSFLEKATAIHVFCAQMKFRSGTHEARQWHDVTRLANTPSTWACGPRLTICVPHTAVAASAQAVIARAVDVTDTAAVKAFVDEVASSWGGVDVLVNNAGQGRGGNLDTLTPEQIPPAVCW